MMNPKRPGREWIDRRLTQGCTRQVSCTETDVSDSLMHILKGKGDGKLSSVSLCRDVYKLYTDTHVNSHHLS